MPSVTAISTCSFPLHTLSALRSLCALHVFLPYVLTCPYVLSALRSLCTLLAPSVLLAICGLRVFMVLLILSKVKEKAYSFYFV